MSVLHVRAYSTTQSGQKIQWEQTYYSCQKHRLTNLWIIQTVFEQTSLRAPYLSGNPCASLGPRADPDPLFPFCLEVSCTQPYNEHLSAPEFTCNTWACEGGIDIRGQTKHVISKYRHSNNVCPSYACTVPSLLHKHYDLSFSVPHKQQKLANSSSCYILEVPKLFTPKCPVTIKKGTKWLPCL